MFNSTKNAKTLTVAMLAGAAGVLVSGSAAFAVPYNTQGAMIEPQTPIYSSSEYTYTRTERPVPMVVDSTRVYDRDMETATTTQQLRAEPRAVQNPDGIRYLSGGVGADEQAHFEAAQSQYPVKMTFANSNGAYMSNVDVTVTDKSGNTVLGMQTDGPILLMDLKPGNYTVKANDNGQIKTQNITVSNAGTMKSYTLHFKSMEPQDYSMNAE